MHRTRFLLAALLALGGALLVGCSDDEPASGGGGGGGGEGDLTVGFIYVGPKDDFGYNQAAYEGSQAVEAMGVEVLQAENVPETAEATQAMQEMIDQGADLIFATSFGHMEFAYELAEANPDVTFVHQGGLEPEPALDNFGTYFGTVYEPVYLAGIAAGAATESDKLGYVYAFPIPQTLANINAFTLGAQSVNPDAETITIQTGSWCDPGLQAEAAQSLLDQDVDVISQHQDCTKTIIEATEAAGAFSVGYHADASELAPEGWLAGSEWDWAPLYTQIVEAVQAGEFAGSDFNGNYRVGLQTGDNPFVQSEHGPGVDEETRAAITAAEEAIKGGRGVFTGPISNQDGDEVVAEGESLTYEDAETMDYFVEGVVGTIES
ncbi:MAG TPA: BMP family ABC transporter substrate-binding protein [Iamia sp.]|nr:BMP family ABC transporter substrate-binding protein [Iamia sp.]